jgi:hypothetical protein
MKGGHTMFALAVFGIVLAVGGGVDAEVMRFPVAVHGRFIPLRRNSLTVSDRHALLSNIPTTYSPLRGCSNLGFAVNATIGGSLVPLILDTSSSSIVVGSTLCASDCSTMPSLYNVSSGTTQGTTGTAVYAAGYTTFYTTSSSASGIIYSDLVTVSGEASIRMNFLAMETNTFVPQGPGEENDQCANIPGTQPNLYSGILGLAETPTTVSGTNSWIAILAASAFVTQYSIWFCGSAGELTLGGESDLPVNISWAPMVGGVMTNAITVNQIAFGSLILATGPIRAQLNTATPVSTVPFLVYQIIAATLNANTAWTSFFGTSFFDLNPNPSYALCAGRMNASPDLNAIDATVPKINITIGDSMTVLIPITKVLFYTYQSPYEGDEGWINSYCSAIYPNMTSNNTMTLGSVFLESFQTTYDLQSNAVGFALNPMNQTCSGNVTITPYTPPTPPTPPKPSSATQLHATLLTLSLISIVSFYLCVAFSS